MNKIRIYYHSWLWMLAIAFPVSATSLPDTIAKIKPSIIAIGTYNRLAKPTSQILGTGFIIGNGNHVATNAHVIPANISKQNKVRLVVFVGHGSNIEMRNATIAAVDETHDLAILSLSGSPLPPLTISSKRVREGELYAFTGFPIGAVLGLNPVTHRGIISSITPVATPAQSTKTLSIKQLKALKNSYRVYQLDATAYPGNSGSPVYDPNTGQVIAIINKVLVKKTKESLLSNPSAITYAIPAKYLKALNSSIK